MLCAGLWHGIDQPDPTAKPGEALVRVKAASSIFIGGPILIYFNLRPRAETPAKPAPGETPAKA